MPHSPIRNLTRCAIFTAILCICGWIAIPLPGISITMQTFGVFLALGTLGGAWGTAACGVYLLLGLVGLPVFTGFQGGISALLGPTGGYLWGFLAASMVYWAVTSLFPRQTLMAMILGLLTCYSCGTLWYCYGYLACSTGSILPILAQCVLPYLVPDLAKLLLAHRLCQKLRSFVR